MNLRGARVILGLWTLLLLTACGGTPSATTATVQPPTTTVVPSPQPSTAEPFSGFTAGTYTTIVTEADVTNPDLAANVGSWRLRFTGKDATSGSFDVMLNGENLFTGAYTLKGDQIILTDNSPCTAKEGGTYRWISDGKQLTLVALTDRCEERKFVFTVHPLTITLIPTRAGSMLKPGDKSGDMVLTTGPSEGMKEIWMYCDPFVTESGVFTKECGVPGIPDLFIGYGIVADTTGELDAAWPAMTWELTLDDHPVNLSAFGVLDQDDVVDGRPVKRRSWNVVLHQSTPGKHTLRYVLNESGKPTDVTWVFTVNKTYPTPSSAVNPGQHPYTSQLAHVNFLLYLPNKYGKDAQQEWPLILDLHGVGERGYDLEVLKKQPLPEMLEQKADFTFIVVSPQLSPEKDSWSDMIDSLNILLDEVQKAYKVDSQRIYLTGLSMGGAGTWEFGLRYPERFAALVPIAGFYDFFDPYEVPDNICDLRDVPIWVFHGSSDSVVPPLGTEVLVNALKTCGGNVRFTLYPNADHEDTWRQAYADPELYTWLLSQTLR